MQEKWLPGNTMDRIRDLCRSRNINCKHYTDDGWSGGNFERPGWQQMMTDIDSGKIGTVLVKDMSRVGRDYLQTGFYTEIYFKEKDVRFIAIDSHVDNSCSDSLEFAPMLNVLNEMYLHDLSKKVNIGFKVSSAESVVRICSLRYVLRILLYLPSTTGSSGMVRSGRR